MTTQENKSNRQISLRIKYIFNHFYLTRAQEKYNNTYRFIDTYIDYQSTFNNNYIVDLSHDVLASMIDSYFLDVIRYKEYHFNPAGVTKFSFNSEEWTAAVHGKHISINKALALTTKWMLKFKPVNIRHKDPEYKPNRKETIELNSFNAKMCLTHIRDLAENSGASVEILEDKEVMSDLLYHFRFRSFDERHFFLIYNQLLRA